jgi:hypothetical protein
VAGQCHGHGHVQRASQNYDVIHIVMGSCSSCLRRRRTTAEESPLISHQRSTRKERSSLEKAADIVAAINAGKLPSQDQLTQLLQLCLRSGILVDTPGHGPVSKDGQRVVLAVRDLVQCLLELGLQVNCEPTVARGSSLCTDMPKATTSFRSSCSSSLT